jgi:hypothetical protein
MQPRSNLRIRRLEASIVRLYDQESFHANMAEHCRGEITKKEAKLDIYRQEEVERFYFDYAGIEDKIIGLLAADAACEKSLFDGMFGVTGGAA